MRVPVGTIEVDVVDQRGAIAAIDALVDQRRGGSVFTPNVDHVVRATKSAPFREAYARARLSLADGQPVVWTARLSGFPLRARVTGADLFMPLLAHASARGWGVYIIGGRVGAKERMLERLARELPSLRVAIGSPTRVIAGDEARLALEADAVRAMRPELVFVCLGSPLQEMWADRVAAELAPSLFFGFGSAMDVAAGMQERAPLWMQRSGLEWLFRLGSEPTRLWRRYLDNAQVAPILLRSVIENRRRRR